MKLTDDQIKLLLQFQVQEITGNHIYNNLANREKDTHNQSILRRIAGEEKQHYQVYKVLTQQDVKPNRLQLYCSFPHTSLPAPGKYLPLAGIDPFRGYPDHCGL
ncbi:MAG: hypothetical protein JW801_07460 [Bacteroidales bacterium]|nr:hypothetical protein [Bacteroidales bacterium]